MLTHNLIEKNKNENHFNIQWNFNAIKADTFSNYETFHE